MTMSAFVGSVCMPEMAGSLAVSAAPVPVHTACSMSPALLPSGHGMPVPMMWAQPAELVDASSGLSLSPPMTAVHMPYQSMELMAQISPAQQHYTQGSTSTIFFAGVTPIVATETLLSVFAQFGRVMDLNLFRPYKGCRTSKGCGLVVFAQHSEAAAALETLNGRFVWPGARSPMVIEWCDPSKQHKRKRAQPLAPSMLQQVLAFQPQVMTCMPPMMPPTSISLGFLPDGNAGRLMMPGY